MKIVFQKVETIKLAERFLSMTEEGPKETEEVSNTPDRGIPLNVKEKRGCMTSPINKANSRTNMQHLEREWSEMMKIAKETKQKLKG